MACEEIDTKQNHKITGRISLLNFKTILVKFGSNEDFSKIKSFLKIYDQELLAQEIFLYRNLLVRVKKEKGNHIINNSSMPETH